MSATGMKQKKVGDVIYTFNSIPASQALKLAPMVARVADMLIAKASAGLNGASLNLLFAEEDKGLSPEKAAEVQAAKEGIIKTLVAVFAELPGDDWVTPDGRRMLGTVSFLGMLLKSVEVKGAPIDDMDTFFTGRMADMFKVAYGVMEHNFLGSAAAGR